MGQNSAVSIGIDVGGTFTDFVIYYPSSAQLETFKLLSSPHDPAVAVLQGLEKILGKLLIPAAVRLDIVHGSTVATNALLERKGARTALIATRGFGDVIQIGRQNRPQLYNLLVEAPRPLIPTELRYEVDERVDAQGHVLHSLLPEQVDQLIPILHSQQVESVAVCLLFSFLHPEHEQVIAHRLRQAGFSVSASHEILPEFREYERTSTTAVNAYVSPVLDRYLSHLEAGVNPSSRLRVMQSNGGAIQATVARQNGVQCILSGPAGGVIGCHHIATRAIHSPQPEAAQDTIRVITFDMGGTSTDVSLIEGNPRLTSDAVIGGHPISIPVLDIHTIGAGGGSIARLDAGGALQVGPQSAGADPGPACYGKGDLPTVTDANLVLGRLASEFFLAGSLALNEQRAMQALSRLGSQMDMSPQQAAMGIIQVANAHMMRALRVISVERGHDPRRFTLLSFGGAGGLHAADLARSLGIPQVLVPPLASTLSAYGMLVADIVKDYSLTVMLPGDTPLDEIDARLIKMAARGLQDVTNEGLTPDRVIIERSADLRYTGQSYELNVPFSPQLIVNFHHQHERFYGYSRPEAPIEIVNLRLRAVGKVDPPLLPTGETSGADPTPAYLGKRTVIFEQGALDIPFFRGEHLQAGNHLVGPAVIVRNDTTILIGFEDQLSVDLYLNLFITIGSQ